MAALTAEAVPKMFRLGQKQVFMPAHTITFVRPKPKQPANWATFKVPMKFNKLDMRDYLLHAYNVPVTAVRSQVKAQAIRHSNITGRKGRKPSIKTMTVELKEPFVWPEPPTQEEMSAWVSPTAKMHAEQSKEQYRLRAKLYRKGTMPLRVHTKRTSEFTNLRIEAKRLLREGGWDNKREIDPKFITSEGKEETREQQKKDKKTKSKSKSTTPRAMKTEKSETTE
ncbi:ribosomal protein L23-domain-containing protein [Xylariaceae sp. FL1272]|nr:ribosomal protein L23-domain-containing protein [Xylariaceae sp. FL1272]